MNNQIPTAARCPCEGLLRDAGAGPGRVTNPAAEGCMNKTGRITAAVVLLAIALFALGMKAEELRVKWLESVVTEAWTKAGPNSWTQVQPAIYGQRGDCGTVIGLREDGIVVWKYRDEAKNK
jgi:hypothetical protein